MLAHCELNGVCTFLSLFNLREYLFPGEGGSAGDKSVTTIFSKDDDQSFLLIREHY